MVFSSNIFLFFFLPAVLALYRLCPKKYRNLLLLAVSLFFYGWGEPVYLLLMAAAIIINYFAALGMDAAGDNEIKRRRMLIVSLVLDLGMLAFFKYTGFFVKTLNSFLPDSAKLPVPNIPLPIGISFYIFQSMSYVIDLYRRNVTVQRSIVKFGAYVTLFPQLIAGPIVRYSDVALQLDERHESTEQFSRGVLLFTVGLAKKLLLGNRMGALWETVQGSGGALSAWVGMLAYTLQIYFDFSGYSDMAIGLGKMLGFTFLKNFDYPYISKSITEFWRRWHISLSTWFREYVYIPLGGNRKGLPRQLLNLFVVWALTGLWHGASWNFVLWGLYYAVWLCLEKLFLLKYSERLPSLFRNLAVLLIVSYGWMLFYFEDMKTLASFSARLFIGGHDSVYTCSTLLAYLPLMLLATLAATPLPAKLAARLPESWRGGLSVCAVLLLLMLCTASLASQSYNPFIYFRF